MKKRLLAAVLSFLIVFAYMPVVFAADDTTAPVLNGVSLNSTAFSRGDTLVVTVDATETESGFDLTRCQVHFICISEEDPSFSLDDFYMNFDALCATGIQGSIVLDERVGGKYYLESIYLCDTLGNESEYYESLGTVPDITFTLNSDYQKPPADPDQGPKISKFTMNKKTASVGNTVVITITASHSSGIASLSMQMNPERVPWYYSNYDVPVSPVAGKPGVYTASFKISSSMPQGEYYPFFTVTSNSGITKYISSSDALSASPYFLKVLNSNLIVPESAEPKLTSFSISSHKLVQGQQLNVTVTLDSKSPVFDRIVFGFLNRNSGKSANPTITLKYNNGKYTGSCRIPTNLRNGTYCLGTPTVLLANGDGGGAEIPSSLQATIHTTWSDVTYIKGSEIQVINVLSISGTANKTILAGSPFDPMAGVTAKNAYTGDITGKVTVSGGSFDTNVPGLYLVKYILNDTITIDGTDNAVSYTDYRWIGVSKVMPDASAGSSKPLAVTDGALAIGAASGEATIQKDGSTISYAGSVTAPGVYTVTCSGSSASGAPAAQRSAALSESTGAGKSATAVIDKTGPAAKAAWYKVSSGMSVALKAIDVSGVAEVRYLTGACGLAQCKASGAVYSGAFKIPGYCKITVYTRDNLGNESAKVFTINTPDSGSARLTSFGLSAGKLSRPFSSKVTSYKLKLGESTGSVTITPVAEWDGSKITIAGKVCKSATVSVANGKTKTVTVKVAYGKSSKTYKLTISRAKSTNNRLAALTASAGAFNAAFDPAVTSYRLTLGENTKGVKLGAIASSKLARVTVSSKYVKLNNGETKAVKIRVRAQSGATRTYTVTISRAKSTDASLKLIKTCSAKLPLQPSFSPKTTTYTITLPTEYGSVYLTFKANGYKAAVYVNGTKRLTKKVAVSRGQTVTVKVEVKAQAGNTRTYTIAVTRK